MTVYNYGHKSDVKLQEHLNIADVVSLELKPYNQ
jgi:hypothetical protein